MSYPFLENADPGLVAKVDQLHAEHSHRITACMALALGAKLLYKAGDREGCKYLADIICETLAGTEADELVSMLTLAIDTLANHVLDGMDPDEKVTSLAAARQSVIDFKAGKYDPVDCAGPEEGLADL